MALFIGAYLPDRRLDDTPFSKALTRVAAGLAKLRQNTVQSSAPNVDLHFLMPGQSELPGFEGMRFHSYDPASRTLRIESSVPGRMLGSTHAEAFVIAAMQDAIDNAKEFFTSQKADFTSEEYFELVDRLIGVPMETVSYTSATLN
ncbi:hypothetical protein [Marinobacterium mangrovicola]|uniref:Uncharacterized protein n=1 Tax=Marinobacterium mangrovicola TaxID=1476959 RepID=A0A4R1GLB5_9GAMM|nr:hypothetical protein [Marinobacterium mangrovicola]TCK09008.1 hypothetical protein CLV83_1106 [Marinobacterium mangrovicola]